MMKENKPVNPKGNQPWILIGRTDAEAQAPVPGPHDVKSKLTGKDPDAEKDWRQKEKGEAEDEIVGWHYQLNEHEFEQTPGDSERQESLHVAVRWVTKGQTQLSNWSTKQLKMMVGDSIYTNPISPRLEPPSEKINYKRTVYQKYLNS